MAASVGQVVPTLVKMYDPGGGRNSPPPLEPMKENINSGPGSAEASDVKLSTLLRESRISPALPPRFQENVWHRIGKTEAPAASMPGWSWLDALAVLVLRPRFALATAVVLVLAGALLGARAGDRAANQGAQTQYLTAVAPPAMR